MSSEAINSSRINLRDQAIDSEEVVTPLMLDGTYLSRNFATLGPMIRQPGRENQLYVHGREDPLQIEGREGRY